jgi:hypothetical protein
MVPISTYKAIPPFVCLPNILCTINDEYGWLLINISAVWPFTSIRMLYVTLKRHPANIEASMTLPTRPHAIFSTWQGAQSPTQSQPCQELKMPTPHAHPPPSGRNAVQQHLNISARQTHQQKTTVTTKRLCRIEKQGNI